MAYCSKLPLPNIANSINRFQSIPCPSVGGRAATIAHIMRFDFSRNRESRQKLLFGD
jgi:hypothetical protein